MPRISSIDRIRILRVSLNISCFGDAGLRRASNLERVARRTTSKSYDGGLRRFICISVIEGGPAYSPARAQASPRNQAHTVCLGLF